MQRLFVAFALLSLAALLAPAGAVAKVAQIAFEYKLAFNLNVHSVWLPEGYVAGPDLGDEQNVTVSVRCDADLVAVRFTNHSDYLVVQFDFDAENDTDPPRSTFAQVALLPGQVKTFPVRNLGPRCPDRVVIYKHDIDQSPELRQQAIIQIGPL